MKLSPAEKLHLQVILYQYWEEHPFSSLQKFLLVAEQAGFSISRKYLQCIFKEWNFTFHQPSRQQLQKLSIDNILYYPQFLISLQDIPLEKLKYLDEASFASRKLLKQKILGPADHPFTVFDRTPLSSPTLTITVMTTLSDPDSPIRYTLHTGSNTQWDFLSFLLDLLENRDLVAGDYLILDNARIHDAIETWDLIETLFQLAQVHLIFLPTFSPELNPCELVHAQVKRFIRENPSNLPLWFQISLAVSTISFQNVFNYYCKCTQFPTFL